MAFRSEIIWVWLSVFGGGWSLVVEEFLGGRLIFLLGEILNFGSEFGLRICIFEIRILIGHHLWQLVSKSLLVGRGSSLAEVVYREVVRV